MELPHLSEAFGLRWRSDIALPGFDPSPHQTGADSATIAVHRVDRPPDRGEPRRVNRRSVYPDGARFAWRDEAVFDIIDGAHVAYCSGETWTGVMPASFYSTVAALTLAWRGIVPLHACAVEIEGCAVLVAGAAGAGKSTLTAGLLGQGARFVADDLVAVSVGADGGIAIPRGRPTIRLHADTAAALESTGSAPVEGDPRGKWLARPTRRSTADALPLGAVLFLEEPGETGKRDDLERLLAHIFRRRWLAALPIRGDIVKGVLAIRRAAPSLTYAPGRDFGADAQRRRAEEVAAILRAALTARRG